MRFIVDRVLLNTGLESASRLAWLQLAGALFLGVIVGAIVIALYLLVNLSYSLILSRDEMMAMKKVEANPDQDSTVAVAPEARSCPSRAPA